jgi:hypothetical protein
MRSNRLALLSVAVGAALLGVSTAGVSAIAGGLPQPTPAPPALHHHHHDVPRGL